MRGLRGPAHALVGVKGVHKAWGTGVDPCSLHAEAWYVYTGKDCLKGKLLFTPLLIPARFTLKPDRYVYIGNNCLNGKLLFTLKPKVVICYLMSARRWSHVFWCVVLLQVCTYEHCIPVTTGMHIWTQKLMCGITTRMNYGHSGHPGQRLLRTLWHMNTIWTLYEQGLVVAFV